jgi:hypothetical protein
VQTILINVATRHGLGRRQANLPDDELEQYYKVSSGLPTETRDYIADASLKASFTAHIIAIGSFAAAKLSVLQVVHKLEAADEDFRRRWIERSAIVLWAIFSILALAFQCSIAAPWIYTPQGCNHGGLVYTVASLNVLTELYLAIVFVPKVWKLQIWLSSRWMVTGLLMARLL